MAKEKIYQSFNLSLEGAIRRGAIAENAGIKLIKKLQNKKYEVLRSLDYHMGVPATIVVGFSKTKKAHLDIQSDFYEIAKSLGLTFNLGSSYILENNK